jgi:hypothetical protein
VMVQIGCGIAWLSRELVLSAICHPSFVIAV